VRNREIRKLAWLLYCRASIFVFYTAVPLLVSAATFYTYVKLGNVLTAAEAFTSLALFNIVRFPLAMLPNVINNLVEANVSLKRVSNFLEGEDLDPLAVLRTNQPAPPGSPAIFFQNDATFTWGQRPGTPAPSRGYNLANYLYTTYVIIRVNTVFCFILYYILLLRISATLYITEIVLNYVSPISHYLYTTYTVFIFHRLYDLYYDTGGSPNASSSNLQAQSVEASRCHLADLNLMVRHGELCCVVGPVGSGKSTLLSACIGELTVLQGSVSVRGKVAYVSQTAFILNGTLRDNILFGREYEEQFYNEVRVFLVHIRSPILSCCSAFVVMPGDYLCGPGFNSPHILTSACCPSRLCTRVAFSPTSTSCSPVTRRRSGPAE
jgi:ABC-type multidrug transport system fused ATPase/permease subunit